jgi:ribosome-binding factor A
MESKRQQKFAGVIQQDLAAIFQREGMNYLPHTLVTITKVRVTPDLAIARVFLSFFNNTDNQQALHVIKSARIRDPLQAGRPYQRPGKDYTPAGVFCG